jgi:hypothetical protein
VSKKWEKMMGVMYAYGSQHVTVKQLGLWLHLMPKEKEVWTTGDVDFFPQKRNDFSRKKRWSSGQDCQMVYFQTKIPNLVKFWSVVQQKMLV